MIFYSVFFYLKMARIIFGIGVDIVKVSRIARLVERYGGRFLRRAFHPLEIARHERYVASGLVSKGSEFLASRWAVKEATLKAFNGYRIPFPNVHVLKGGGDVLVSPPRSAAFGIPFSGGGNAPRLQFDGALAELAASLRIVEHHVSVSHEEEHAMAQVVLLAAGAEDAGGGNSSSSSSSSSV